VAPLGERALLPLVDALLEALALRELLRRLRVRVRVRLRLGLG